MQGSGSSEDRLRGAQLIGKPAKHFSGEPELRIRPLHSLRPHGVDGRLAADPQLEAV